ncbi:alpha/beta fold hydrolase [Amorphoplanes digitatis]|uniref:Putative alpha/beta hydrolase n=1 Tax=Actinoplanes digitatis TaxID=1868 RepID=A0A7W7HUD8_9ACTN|nr:alpha/beta fold hydrolase [Actinoplanes digitatis]MBB4760920.1 putative alpha/beta hydrolase [Actinoplanes digitatis]
MEPRVHPVASSDGLTLTVEEYGAAGSSASVVFLPALGVPVAYYRPLFEHWVARGRHVVGVELRGMPRSPVSDLRRDSFGYAHLLREDLPAIFTDPTVAAADRVVLVGHSLGGQLALLSGAAGTVRADAVVALATGTSSPAAHRGTLARARRAAGVRFIGAVTCSLGYWPGHRLGFGGRQPRTLMSDWGYEARTGRYRLRGDRTDYEAALSSLAVPALLVEIDGDRMIPRAAVDHLAGRLPAHVGRATIEAVPDHFLWARRTPEKVVAGVEDWLVAQGL